MSHAAQPIACSIALNRLRRQGDRWSADGRLIRIDRHIDDLDDRRQLSVDHADKG
jgi:hypothetical protein